VHVRPLTARVLVRDWVHDRPEHVDAEREQEPGNETRPTTEIARVLHDSTLLPESHADRQHRPRAGAV